MNDNNKGTAAAIVLLAVVFMLGCLFATLAFVVAAWVS
jgi:hypothetical protein